MSEVTQILQDHKEAIVNGLVSSLIETIPMYALADAGEVRERVEMLFGLFLEVIDKKDVTNHCAAHDGVIDKFIGDKIMSVFMSGDVDGARNAAHSALAIQAEIETLNGTRATAGQQPIEVGIGINTGEVVMGTVGSEERMSFTVIGDAVNVADRLQSLAGRGEIFIGARTRELLGETFALEDLGQQTLRGRTHQETMFRLLKAR